MSCLMPYQDPKFSISGNPRAYNILMSDSPEDESDKKGIDRFFKVISLAHSAVVEEDTKNPGQLKYSVSHIN